MSENNKIRVFAPTNIYIDSSFLSGDIEDVIKRLKDIPGHHKKYLSEFKKTNKSKSYDPLWDTIDQYKISYDYDFNSATTYTLEMYREKTEEELVAEEEKREAQRVAQKRAIIVREAAQTKREKTLLKTLKEKYEQ